MIRVLIRALPEHGSDKAITLGQIELHASNQLRLLGPNQGFDVSLTLYKPSPFADQIWKRAELENFDPHIFSPYDLLYQGLHKVVGARTLDPASAGPDLAELTGASWWQQAALGRIPAV